MPKMFFSVGHLIKYGSGFQPSPTKPHFHCGFLFYPVIPKQTGISGESNQVGQKTRMYYSP